MDARRRWSRARVLTALRARARAGKPLRGADLMQEDAVLVEAARKHVAACWPDVMHAMKDGARRRPRHR